MFLKITIQLLLITLFALQSPTLGMSTTPGALMQEGSRIVDAISTLHPFDDSSPTTLRIEHIGVDEVSEFVVFPNQRLAEMEAVAIRKPDSRFRVSGEVFTYDGGNFLLVREVALIDALPKRHSPTLRPRSPDIDRVDTTTEVEEDSIASIVADLEAATGSLARSIRSAADNPVERPSSRAEGVRITNRRGHLVRNNHGAWVVVFVADATGLSDPPCTILPSTKSRRLFAFARKSGLTAPVLVSGEIVTFHGHDFLVLRSWRRVHTGDHLDT